MTDLHANRFKAALAGMRVQRGLWCQITDPLVAEMAAGAGFDWMLFDTEHAPLEVPSVLPLLQAVAPYPVSAIVRPRVLDVALIKKILDHGAQTILVPMVQNAEEAALAVAATRYPPRGIRGVA
ncbi:MAG: 4-hydroxy-2-oxo-heptane-1,7-dioate aldolase, partial [Rhodobacteraceae bacterium]|nr:4-hydroxy-2-oxo-heptane-1,7-dioate aldolase [Paracoccaceae bacterium]